MSSDSRNSESLAPARLSDLVGQARPSAVLRSAISRNRVAHAYLLHGPEGVGKSTAALLFAQALACLDRRRAVTGDSCGRCRSCHLLRGGNHPDLRVVTLQLDRQGRRRTEISIDQIRQNPKGPREMPRPLVQDAILKPLLSPRKIYIIDPAERMSPAASNALLKLLEEPPLYAVLVLVSSQPASLLPTVLSRCQSVAFQLAGLTAIEQHLRSLGSGPAMAASLAALSGGRVGWAISASSQPEVIQVRRNLLDLCASLPAMSLPQSLRLAEEIKAQATRLAQARVDRDSEGAETQEEDGTAFGGAPPSGDRTLRAALPWCLDVMALWYRDRLSASRGGALVNPDYQDALQASLTSSPAHRPDLAAEAVLEAQRQIQRNASIDLTLEALATRLLAGGDEIAVTWRRGGIS